jgi:hypothetical protein
VSPGPPAQSTDHGVGAEYAECAGMLSLSQRLSRGEPRDSK